MHWSIHSVHYQGFKCFCWSILAFSFKNFIVSCCSLVRLLSEISSSDGLSFFSIWVFLHNHSWITGLHRKWEGISSSPHYHFHPLHRHLRHGREITAESSSLHIPSDRTRTRNPWSPNASHWPEGLLDAAGQFPGKYISSTYAALALPALIVLRALVYLL